jgi:hypothetical protein
MPLSSQEGTQLCGLRRGATIQDYQVDIRVTENLGNELPGRMFEHGVSELFKEARKLFAL